MPSDSLWVESRVDLFDRPETAEFADELGVPLTQAVGILHALWHHCMKIRPDGDLTAYSPRRLAWAARWEGDPEKLQEALHDGEWLDDNGFVHNWSFYYDRMQNRREGNRERQRRRRERERGVTNRELWERDSGMCRYCARAVTLREMHVDHVIPPYLGGSNDGENLATACRDCSRKKFNRSPAQAKMQLNPVPQPSLMPSESATVGHVGHALPTLVRHALPTSKEGAEPVDSHALPTVDPHSFGAEPLDSHALPTRGSVNGRLQYPQSVTVSNALPTRGREGAPDDDFEIESAQDDITPTLVTRESLRDYRVSNASTGPGPLTGPRDLSNPELLTTPVVDSSKKTGKRKKSEPDAERLELAKSLFAYYKARIQPQARFCPTEKILSRLEQFTEAQIRGGIDKFAADWWRMENNVGGGYNAEWFFNSDRQVEKWVTLVPRKNRADAPSPRGAATKPTKPDWMERIESSNETIPVRTLGASDDSHSSPVTEDIMEPVEQTADVDEHVSAAF